MQKSTIIKKSLQIGIISSLSKVIAIAREMLIVQYLGVGVISDAFTVAFQLPNRLRKFFAEGTLSSVMIPAFVHAHKENGNSGINRLTPVVFLCVESVVLLICLIVFLFPEYVITAQAKGFSPLQIMYAKQYVQILISFILFLSSGAVFAAALQAQHLLIIPALSPAVLNIIYVSSLLACIWYNWAITTFCWLMVGASVCFFFMQCIAYFWYGFRFEKPDANTWQELSHIMFQFLASFASFGALEISHFIDTDFASHLKQGSVTIFKAAFNFINLPLGILTASFMTALLPYFSQLKYKEKEEIEYHYTQALMFSAWMTLPIVLMMSLFTYKIFQTLYSSKYNPDNIIEAGNNLLAYLIALPFMASNRFLLNVCYIYKITFAPVVIAVVTTGCNYFLNKLLINSMGTAGLALGTSIACILQTIFYMILIHYKAHIKIDFKKFITFLFNYSTQLILASSIFYLIYQGLYTIIAQQTFTKDLIFFTINQSFFTEGLGFWMWVGPLCAVYLATLYGTKKWFNIEIFYL